MKTKELPKRDTIGSIIRNFKTYGIAANLPGHGRNPNTSSRALIPSNPLSRFGSHHLQEN
uniref:Uncharacterized protein n=1 Tax=Dicentrarchus labrax TaxID=13489 RepID=A0A8P4G735_DICLA